MSGGKRLLWIFAILCFVLLIFYMSDAIHPNDEGYKTIAARLEKLLRPLLPKLQGNPLGSKRQQPDLFSLNRAVWV